MAGNASAGNSNTGMDYSSIMNEHPTAIGILGTATAMWSLFISLLPHMTAGVQFLTACVGLAAAITTAIYMRAKLKNLKNEKPD